MILCDTNILVEFYKGNSAIVHELQKIGLSNLSISTITAGELYFGSRDKRELGQIKKNLALVEQIALDADISERFLTLFEEFGVSRN